LEEEVEEEDEEDEEDKEEGGSTKGDRTREEEGCERVDMTNLKTNEKGSEDCSDPFGCRSSMDIRMRKESVFPTPIYSPKMSQKSKCHKISIVGPA